MVAKRERKVYPGDRVNRETFAKASEGLKAIQDAHYWYEQGCRLALGKRVFREKKSHPLQREWLTKRWVPSS